MLPPHLKGPVTPARGVAHQAATEKVLRYRGCSNYTCERRATLCNYDCDLLHPLQNTKPLWAPKCTPKYTPNPLPRPTYETNTKNKEKMTLYTFRVFSSFGFGRGFGACVCGGTTGIWYWTWHHTSHPQRYMVSRRRIATHLCRLARPGLAAELPLRPMGGDSLERMRPGARLEG